ncbi:MAG: glycosyltransferase family 4 protein [Hyphomicrobiaceae bacterium]|nr:glycosyltransferase family 4 protein [Hyphomicrobiaceae bacterium]
MPRTVLLLAQVPPPVHGVTVVTRHVCDALREMKGVSVEQQWAGGAARLEDVGRGSLGKAIQFVSFVISLAIRALAQPKVDVAYLTLAPWATTAIRDAILAACAKRLSRRILVHVHGEGLDVILADTSLRARLIRRFLAGTELVAITTRCRDTGARSKLFTRTWSLPNGSPDPGPRPDTASRTGSYGVLCGTLGNLDPRKGVLRFVDAISAAKAAGIPVLGRIVGDRTPHLSPEGLADLINAKGLEGAICVEGPKYAEEKTDFLHELDVFLYLSRHDHAPLVLIEAMAHGAVPICLDTGGIGEIMGAALAPNLIPSDTDDRDIQSRVLSRLAHYASDPKALATDRQAAYRRYLEAYTEPAFASSLAAIIGEETA